MRRRLPTSDVPEAGQRVLSALEMRASWISAPGADAPGSWLMRRDLVISPLLGELDSEGEAVIESASVLAASTGDVEVLVDGVEVLDVRALGPRTATGGWADVTSLLLPGGTRADHLSLALRLVEGRPVAPGAAPAVLAGLVLRVRRGGSTRRPQTVVVGTDESWSTAPGPIGFEVRGDDPSRPLLEVHDAAWARDDDVADELDWVRFGAMHTDTRRTWVPAVDRGRHPSLVHPPIVCPPELVEEELVPVLDHVFAAGGVQCLDLGQTVHARPVLALPDGARRPITVWGGAVPGTPPRGGDIRVDTHGEAAVLDAHGTTAGRWLHVHGAPDLETEASVVPVRRGVLPRPFGIEVSDELIALLLSDAVASLRSRVQEQYRGEDGTPLLGEIARTARAALLAGGDTWRSSRALEVFLATARDARPGAVVDAVAPGGPRADLDEHTYSLPGWVADHATAGQVPRHAGSVVGGISARLLHRIESGPSPAERMVTAAAALDALDAFARLARRSGDDTEPFARAAATLREQTREALRAVRASGGRGTWLEARGDAESTPRATALALLAGLMGPEDVPFAVQGLRPALADPVEQDPEGFVRAALVRAGEGLEMVGSHRAGDDVPPIVLREVLTALSGLVMDGDRILVAPPSLYADGVDLDLFHPRGEVRIRWDGTAGSVTVPEGSHLLFHAHEGAEPVWYNSGTTAVRRPEPQE